MDTTLLTIVDKKIEELINDTNTYDFNTLKEKTIQILNNVEIFMVDGILDSKAVDLYLKKVITKRNEIAKQKEKVLLENTKENRYKLIEKICKKYEFQTKEELIQKIEELENKSVFELNEILKSL